MLSPLSRAAFAQARRLPSGVTGALVDARPHRRCLSTYYDSQSGLHLPVHDETEIRLFLDVRNQQEEPFIPHRLSKDRLEADEVFDKLQELVQKGIHGLILPAIKFPRDVRNLHTLSVICPPGFVVLNDTTTSESDTVDDGLLKAQEASSSATTFSKILEYRQGSHEDESFRETLQRSTEKGLHTTLSVGEDVYGGDDEDPITLANNIASMIDASGGCDCIWISSNKSENNNVADRMVQVCEELVYLDVAGATIKSRLLVDSLNEDMIEDIMFAGVNKYVIDHEDQAKLVDSVASEQGKALLKL